MQGGSMQKKAKMSHESFRRRASSSSLTLRSTHNRRGECWCAMPVCPLRIVGKESRLGRVAYKGVVVSLVEGRSLPPAPMKREKRVSRLEAVDRASGASTICLNLV